MPEVHAKLSASSSKRWLACPKSVALEGGFPETTTPYAEEGTRAHEMGELILRNKILGEIVDVPKWMTEDLQIPDLAWNPRSGDLEALILMSPNLDLKEMLSFVMVYVNKCLQIYNNSLEQYKDTVAYIEQRLDYSKYAPEGFGTGDFVVIGGNRITVIDLKFGRGVKVDVVDNPQLKLYALGAYEIVDFIYDIEEIENIIVQPRIANGISEFVIKTPELLEWALNYLKPRALLAYHDKGDFQAGEHCKFCKANGRCRAQAMDIIKTLEKYGGKANV